MCAGHNPSSVGSLVKTFILALTAFVYATYPLLFHHQSCLVLHPALRFSKDMLPHESTKSLDFSRQTY